MRTVRDVVRFAAVALAVSAPVATASGQVVEYYTTGTFTCSGCTGSGTSSATFGDLTLSFLSPFGTADATANSTETNPASVNLDVSNPSNASFGWLMASAGSNTLRELDGTFTLNIWQVAPSGGTGSIVGSLSGSLASVGGVAMFMASDDVVDIDGITYRYADLSYNLVPPSTNNGMVSLQGQIGGTFNGGPGGVVVPEPSTYALLGTGMLGLLGVAARRRRASV